jgi:hypothetical protein
MRRKAALAVVLSSLVVLGAYAIPRRIPLVGMGRASEADKSAADSEAYDAAQTNANSMCVGTIENNNYLKTFDSCSPLTDDDGNTTWTCAVNVKVICLVGK